MAEGDGAGVAPLAGTVYTVNTTLDPRCRLSKDAPEADELVLAGGKSAVHGGRDPVGHKTCVRTKTGRTSLKMMRDDGAAVPTDVQPA